ncbi:unnamed protein product [Oikopleura dioica]|uniref:Uncharacterized protein n=1 Tax=Oikopleura dioica TaxID=34765 RepID=E4XDA7_OIKDI|nr:unnamed protein product [Oikopleura dioica]
MEAGKKAAGFVTDFDNLIHRLKAEGVDRASRYSTFTHYWQDLELYKLFDGRASESDKADFIDAAFSCVVQFLSLDGADTHVKTVCIYMLMALYKTQTNFNKRRIRMTPAEFKSLYNFVMNAHDDNRLIDPFSVFWQLYHLGAFEHPATPTQKLLGTSDIWLHAINSDEVSPALENVVAKVPRKAEECEDYIAGVRSIDDEDSVYSRRQRIRQAAQYSRVARCTVAEIVKNEKEAPTENINEDKKIVVRKHQPVETFNQKHLVEKQNYFPKGNKSIYPSKDLVEIANSTKIKRGRPFVVDVESRVIQKGQKGQWHVRKDKLQPESEDEVDTEEIEDEGIGSMNSDDPWTKKIDRTVKSNIQRALKVSRDRVQIEIERKSRMDDLESERSEIDAAREQGVDQKIIDQREKELKKKEKIIMLMGEEDKPRNPLIGRPRKDAPAREDAKRPGPKSDLQKKRKLEADLQKLQKRQAEKEEKRKAKEVEKEAVKAMKKAAKEAEKASSPPKKKRKVKDVKTEYNIEDVKKTAEETKAKKQMEKEERERKKTERAAKPPKLPPHLNFSNLKVGDFFQLEDSELESPQLVKINYVCEESANVRGVYWDMEPGEVGMALYERTWKPTKDHNCEILFCNEDFAQKVYMRKVKPGAHPAAGMKLTAKSAEHVLQLFPQLRDR